MKHGLIGFGNVARAVYQALASEKDLQFAYFTRSKKDVDLQEFDTLAELVAFSDVLWLCVKPQDLQGVLEQLRKLDLGQKLIVSPVAGKKIAFIEEYVGAQQPIVRIMPNLAIAYKKSVTAFATNQPDNIKTEEIFQLLSKLGKAVKLQEEGFDLFTSVFGSGPAFILLFVQIFKDKMQEFDLPGPVLDELLLQLTEGTVSYFAQNQAKYSIEQLVRNITSKGGTTQAGIDYYRENEIARHFEAVLEAARRRSVEMSRGE